VRKLAERSKVAADEIQILARNSVTATEEAGKLLIDLTPEIERTAKLVQEITSASVEQNSGVDQINTSIQQLNTVTQQNAVVSDEIAKNAKALRDYADELRSSTSFFKIEHTLQREVKSFAKAPVISKLTSKVATPAKEETVAPSRPKTVTTSANHGNNSKGKMSSGGINLNMFGEESGDSDYEKF